jgi:hypothetical protein
MKPAGVLVITFVAILIPLLIPVIQQFWPTADVWWSAILVIVLYALLSAVWLVYGKKLQKAGLSGMPIPAPMATPIGQLPDDEDMTYPTPKPQQAPFMKTWLLG